MNKSIKAIQNYSRITQEKTGQFVVNSQSSEPSLGLPSKQQGL